MINRLLGFGAPIAAALVVVLLLAGGNSGYQLRVDLPDADGLRTGSQVKVGGVVVGSVNSLRVTANDHALATLTLNQGDSPVGRNVSVVIRPADLLGEKYLDLSIGNRSHPARSDYTIPADRTQDATDFDQVIDVLTPDVRDRLALLIHETGVALFGRGADLRAVLGALPPSVTDVTNLINQVTASNQRLSGLLSAAGETVGTLAQQRQALTRFINTAGSALQATAANQQALAGTVARAPALLSQLRSSLASLDTAGAALRPAAAGLVQSAPALTQTLNALPGFTTAALPALAAARQIAPQLVSLGRRASPVIARLRPTAQLLQQVAGKAAPVTNALASSIDDVLGLMQNWARAIQTGDTAGHEFRVSTELTPDAIKELLPLITAGAQQPAHKGAAPASSPAKPAPSGAAVTTPATTVSVPKLPLGTLTVPSLTVTTPQPLAKPLQNLLNYLFGK